jgi:uncharacterized protein YjbI with pentapeptide repeats
VDSAFSVAGLPRGILRQADLSQSGFAGVRFTGRHRYLDCRFAGADWSHVQLEPQARAHQFVRCDFTGTKFDGSRIAFALFHECDLRGTHWEGARLERVRFSECALDGVEWSGADFVETRIVSMPPATAAGDAPAPPRPSNEDEPPPEPSPALPPADSPAPDPPPVGAPR